MTVDTENLEHEWIVWTETSKNSMLKVIKELIEKNIEVEWVSALKELIENQEYKKLQTVLGLKWKNADGKLWKLTLEKLYEYIQRQDTKWEFLDVLDSSETDLKAIKWTETSKNSTLPEIKEFLESKLPNIHIQELYDLILKKDYKWFQRKLGMVWKDCDWMLWKKALKALYEQNFPEDTKETEETDNSGVETSETNTGDVVETENVEEWNVLEVVDEVVLKDEEGDQDTISQKKIEEDSVKQDSLETPSQSWGFFSRLIKLFKGKWGGKEKSENKEEENDDEIEEMGTFTENMEYLSKYQQSWIRVNDDVKEKIVEAAKKMDIKHEIDEIGNRLITIKIGDDLYKFLNFKVERYSDNKYKYFNCGNDNVMLWWMIWDNPKDWDNKKLAKFVMRNQKDWMDIPTIEDIKDLLHKLWDLAWLDEESDKIAMFMYLTGIEWRYYLSMWDENKSWSKTSRSMYRAHIEFRWFGSIEGKQRFCDLFLMSHSKE